MSEQTPRESQTAAQVQTDLRQLAALLRDAAHLEPQAQKSLASLIEELGAELDLTGSISAKTARLTEAVSEVARSLHERHPSGPLETARDRLKEAATHTETEAPAMTGVVYRLLEFLSSMGI